LHWLAAYVFVRCLRAHNFGHVYRFFDGWKFLLVLEAYDFEV